MKSKKIIGFIYDFDKTLTPKNMQEYALFDMLKIDKDVFWEKSKYYNDKEQMDHVLSYMYVMTQLSKNITRDLLNKAGSKIEFYNGVETWFDRINKYAKDRGFNVEHYVVSAGQLEIIEGCSIFNKFTKVLASEFHYTKEGCADWPKIEINYTMKTQYLFRINKNVFGLSTNDQINRAMKEEDRHISFENMIYIGDGYSDVPAMKLVRHLGGHSIAVYDKINNEKEAEMLRELVSERRVDYLCNADYTENSDLDNKVKTLIDYITGMSRFLDVDKIK